MKKSDKVNLNNYFLFIICSYLIFPSIASAYECKIKVSYSNNPVSQHITGSERFVIHANSTQVTTRKHMRIIKNIGDRDVKITYWNGKIDRRHPNPFENRTDTIKKGKTKYISGDLKRTQCKNTPVPRTRPPRRLPDLSVRTIDVQYKNGRIYLKTRFDNKGSSTRRVFKIKATLYRNGTVLQRKLINKSLAANATYLWQPSFRGNIYQATKITVKIDSQNVIRESKENNNTAARSFITRRTAELSLRITTVHRKSKIRIGNLYRYWVKARTRMDNGGSKPANRFKTTAKLQCQLTPRSSFRTYKTKTIIKSLSAGGTYLWQPVLKFKNRNNLKRCRVFVEIDSSKKIRENSEHNNLSKRIFRF